MSDLQKNFVTEQLQTEAENSSVLTMINISRRRFFFDFWRRDTTVLTYLVRRLVVTLALLWRLLNCRFIVYTYSAEHGGRPRFGAATSTVAGAASHWRLLAHQPRVLQLDFVNRLVDDPRVMADLC